MTDRVAEQLRKADRSCARQGTRLTELRRDVLGLMLAARGPSTAYQLLDKLRATRSGAVPPTVYRALDFLMARGLVHKVESLNAFIACLDPEHATPQHHHAAQFLICTRCGVVAEIEDAAVSAAVEAAAGREGFAPKSAIVEVEGLCAVCCG